MTDKEILKAYFIQKYGKLVEENGYNLNKEYGYWICDTVSFGRYPELLKEAKECLTQK